MENAARQGTDHLEGLPPHFAALSDCDLVHLAPGSVTRLPVHTLHLARYSGHCAALLSSVGDGTVASSSKEELAAALSKPLADAGATVDDATAFLRLLYALPNRQALSEALCSMQKDAGGRLGAINWGRLRGGGAWKSAGSACRASAPCMRPSLSDGGC